MKGACLRGGDTPRVAALELLTSIDDVSPRLCIRPKVVYNVAAITPGVASGVMPSKQHIRQEALVHIAAGKRPRCVVNARWQAAVEEYRRFPAALFGADVGGRPPR